MGATKPSIDFIYDILEKAYTSGISYDVSDMYTAIFSFAAESTHQKDYCLKKVDKMHLKSEDKENVAIQESFPDDRLAFFDVEVFPNLFLVNWKFDGPENGMRRMINPSPSEIEDLLTHKLVGFNCRRYDNHILYGRLIGYTNQELFELSQGIINGEPGRMFREAYNLSYTDIYDFSSKKQSLKKFEIELEEKALSESASNLNLVGHMELGLPWDQPVPEELWDKVSKYCDNDVLATEALFHDEDRQADFLAREILADLTGSTVNDTTNTLSARFIFGSNRHPQDQFNYRKMGEIPAGTDVSRMTVTDDLTLYSDFGDEYTVFDSEGRPYFPGYEYKAGVSTYRGEEVGEGGYVFAVPGMYSNVVVLDVMSMHPSSVIAENLFGDEYTAKFKAIVDARKALKHGDIEKAVSFLPAIGKYLSDRSKAKAVSAALKIVINSVYGLTSASFDNPFRDIRNEDNIVAKRGALFMINLKHEVLARGFEVVHIKTDSIKIPNATEEIISFVKDYGKQYGYTFEIEDEYEKMCLVNNAVYIAKLKGEDEWKAVGTQFQVPFVFKTLFSKKPINFNDLCETKEVKTALYLDLNENLGEDEHDYRFVGKVGRFCPMQSGAGGGLLVRSAVNKKTGDTTYSAVTGTKGYRWMESEMVRIQKKEDQIDKTYYNKLVDEAVETISQFGDFEQFIS